MDLERAAYKRQDHWLLFDLTSCEHHLLVFDGEVSCLVFLNRDLCNTQAQTM